jgi:inosine/xanthosine triphosphate pyrophosphatase family protein
VIGRHSKPSLIVATRNRAKVEEISRLLDERVNVIGVMDEDASKLDWSESGETFEAIAAEKARRISDLFRDVSVVATAVGL